MRGSPASSRTRFVRRVKPLRVLQLRAGAHDTPHGAMAAGITDRLWSVEDIVAKIDAMAPPPKPRGPYKTRA